VEVSVRKVQRVNNQYLINIPVPVCQHLKIRKGDLIYFQNGNGFTLMGRYDVPDLAMDKVYGGEHDRGVAE
jgi:hypothetical protein